MVQLREGTQKIVDMYNDKNENKGFYMSESLHRTQVRWGRESRTYDEFVEAEHSLDNQKFDNNQSLVNHVMEFIDRDDREFVEKQIYGYSLSEEERSDLTGEPIIHIRANDDSDELNDMKELEQHVESYGAPKKYFVSYSDLNDFDKDLSEQLSDKIADGISMNEVVENFNELSQAQETGNERVEQLELNLEGLDDEKDLFPGK